MSMHLIAKGIYCPRWNGDYIATELYDLNSKPGQAVFHTTECDILSVTCDTSMVLPSFLRHQCELA